MSEPNPPADRAGDDRIDADHPRPDRGTPYRTGQGHGDDSAGDTAPDAGLTGDDVAPGDGSASHDDDEADVERYRNSPGAGLVRGDDVVPEPNEPG